MQNQRRQIKQVIGQMALSILISPALLAALFLIVHALNVRASVYVVAPGSWAARMIESRLSEPSLFGTFILGMGMNCLIYSILIYVFLAIRTVRKDKANQSIDSS